MNGSLQHNDHCWLTVRGKAWAIQAIKHNRLTGRTVIYLWRGLTWPELEYYGVDVTNVDWPAYVAKAVALLEAEART